MRYINQAVRVAVGGTLLSLGCMPSPNTEPAPMSVWVRSHNRSAVDVYLLCGQGAARYLGAVSGRASEALEIPPRGPYCASGLNFFLVVQASGRGYWVGPFRPMHHTLVELVIEKYAGLSEARLRP